MNSTSYIDSLKNLSKDTLINSIIEEKAKNARISFAFNATDSGIWEWDTSKNEIFFSAECFRLLGINKSDSYYDFDKLKSIIHPKDRSKLDEFSKIHLEAYPYNRELEFRIQNNKGKYIWVRSTGKVKNDLNEVPVLIGILNNVTNRKKLEKKVLKYQEHLEGLIKERTNAMERQNVLLQEKETSYSNLLKNMQGMAYQYRNDDDWTLQYVSEGSEELTGFKLDEFLSMQVRMETHVLFPEYADSVWIEITKCLDSKQSFKVTYPIRTKQGVNKWVLDRGRGVYDDDGHLVYLEGVIVDITEQKNQELEYKMAQVTMDKAPIAIEWIKKDGSFHYVNEMAVNYSGYTREEFLKMKIFDVDPDLNPSEWNALFEKRMKSEVKDLETTYHKKDGSIIPVLINAANIEYDEGEILNCSFINEIIDIKNARIELQRAYDEIATSEEELRQRTEELNAVNDHLVDQKNILEDVIIKLRDTKDQLVQAEKMASLGVLVAGIAHELNNPINYISTSADALQMVIADVLNVVSEYKKINRENYHEKLIDIERLSEEMDFDELLDDLLKMGKNINVGAEQAADIVRGLKSFSRMESGEFSKHNVSNIIDNVLLMLHNNYKHRIKIIKDYYSIPEVECYPSKLSQVFMNLITNAIQSIENEGEINIVAIKKDDFIVLTISDTGSGIPEEKKTRIFEPFYTTKDTGMGTGLGLSITLGIMEDHHGEIELESEEGKGTTFRVMLPIVQPLAEE